MARSGRDPSQFARDLLAHLRHLLVTQTTGEVPDLLRRHRHRRRPARRPRRPRSAPATLVRTIDELASALTAVREGDDARMAVEIALLKAARPDLDPSTEGLLRRIERLEGQLGSGGGRAAGPVAAQGTPRRPAVATLPRGAPLPAPPAAEPPAAATPPAAGAARAEPTPSRRSGEWRAEGTPEARSRRSRGPPSAATGPAGQGALDLEKLKQVWPRSSTAARDGAGAGGDLRGRPAGRVRAARVVEIGFPADATFNKRKAEAPEQAGAGGGGAARP